MEYCVYANMLLSNEGETVDTEYDLSQLKFNWKKSFKSAWLNFASIGIWLAILAQVQIASATYVSTNGSCLNIRTGPSINYSVVDCVCNGNSLPRVVSYENGFAQLSSGNWVSAEWISTTPSYGYYHSSYSNYGVGGEYPDYFNHHHHHHHHDYYSSYPKHHHHDYYSSYPRHHHHDSDSDSTEYYPQHYNHYYYGY